MKRLLGGVVLVFLAWFIFTQPQAAGDAVHAMLLWLQTLAESLSTAIRHATH